MKMKRLVVAALVAAPLAFGGLVAAAETGKNGSHAKSAPGKLTICHKTGSASNAFVRITVSSRALSNPNSASGKLLRKHLLQTGDAIVVGTGACPSPSATPSPSSTPPQRIEICHKTHSTKNPFVRIMVSSRAVTNPNSKSGKTLRGHMRHTGDILEPGASACPSGAQQTQGVKLTADLTPVQNATGSGSATITIRIGKSQLCFTLQVSGLTNVTASHIHRVSTQAIVVPLTTSFTGTASGCVTVNKTLLKEIVANPGAFYVNVHTSAFPNGQIRGDLSK
jgi:hypothetical protein